MCEITIYDNTNLYDDFEEIREQVFEEQADVQDWLLPTDVPDYIVDMEIQFRDEMNWQECKSCLERMFKDGYYLLKGTCGRWDGNYEGGKFIDTVDELLSCIDHLDSITIVDKDGHLMIDGSHHDGNDHYELKKLTKKGYELANNNYFANNRTLHEKIWRCNFFSTLPRLATI